MGKSRKTITFRDAVKKCPAIGGGLCDGLQALSQQYRGKVRQSKNVRVTGSIDIDSTLKRQCPTPVVSSTRVERGTDCPEGERT